MRGHEPCNVGHDIWQCGRRGSSWQAVLEMFCHGVPYEGGAVAYVVGMQQMEDSAELRPSPQKVGALRDMSSAISARKPAHYGRELGYTVCLSPTPKGRVLHALLVLCTVFSLARCRNRVCWRLSPSLLVLMAQ